MIVIVLKWYLDSFDSYVNPGKRRATMASSLLLEVVSCFMMLCNVL